MRFPTPASLRTRLILLVLAALLPGAGLFLYAGYQHRAEAADRARENLGRLAGTVAASSQQVFDSARQLLVTLSAVSQVRDIRSPACDRVLAGLLDPSGPYANIGVAAADGLVHCSAISTPAPVDASDRRWFRETIRTKSFGVGEYQIGRITKRSSINFGYPLLDKGRVVGVLFAALDLGWLDKQLAGKHLPPGGVLLVADRRGVVLSRRPDPEEWIGKTIADQPLARAMIDRGDGSTRLADSDHVSRIYAFRTIRGNGVPSVFLAIGTPESVVFAEANSAFRRGLLLLIAAGAGALIAASVLSRQLLAHPLRAILAATHRVRAGDLGARTGLRRTEGEIGQLAAGFDAMASSLQDWEVRLREAERKAVEERFKGLLEIAADAIITVDASQRILLFNKGAEELFGFPADEMIGHPLGDVMPWRFADTYGQQMRSFGAAPAGMRPIVERREIEAKRRDGSVFQAEATLSRAGSNAATTFTLILRDISDRHRAELALRKSERRYAEAYERERVAAEHLRSLDRLKSEFVGMVAHDIRSPMAIISGFADLMEYQWETLTEERKTEMLGIISRNAQGVASMVEDVLQVAKIETGEMEYEIAPFDLGALARRTVEEMQSIETGRDLVAEIPENLPLALGDEGKLWRVQMNLLGNALKFSPADRPVTVAVTVANGELHVSVRDRGIGLREEDMPKLFQKFSRVEQPGVGPKVSGTGLGLFVCRSIVETLGGRIRVESVPGAGSVFTYTVPAAREGT